MKDLLRAGIIFLSGAAVGGFFGWFSTKSYYKNLADEEIESVKEMCRVKILEQDKKVKTANEKVDEVKEEKHLLERVIKDSGLTVYSNFSSDEDTLNDSPSEDERSAEDSVYESSPYLIDEEQYSTEAIHYQKLEVRYYSEDGIYCDETDEIIEDFMFGDKKDMIPELLKTESMVYVRNDHLETDYEIQLIENSYQEAILGGTVEED